MAGKRAGNRFKADRSYKIGMAAGSPTAVTIRWKQRPKPQIFLGKTFVDAGCEYFTDFWERNPIDGKTKEIYTIAEIDPTTQEEVLRESGSFHTPKQITPPSSEPSLADVPVIGTPSQSLPLHSIKVYEDRINELRTTNDRLESEIKAMRIAFDEARAKNYEELRTKDAEISKLKEDLKYAQIELKIVEERVIPRMKQEQKEQQLNDSASARSALFAPALEKVVDKFMDRFLGGGSSTGMTPIEPSGGGTSDDLESRISGV